MIRWKRGIEDIWIVPYEVAREVLLTIENPDQLVHLYHHTTSMYASANTFILSAE